ncbi:NADPH-dependent FMN reductase [Acuticoccus yangtzensis]|uniref:NADPH-dependent FMN reductase n=1 Tax=Acuticoccus yangtzensis TaxID=1443441 RepID=UPI0009495975|nr:NAD(P)H-dependent oxidoreductase [Acuticoccus yangtzensis]
MSYDVAILVGSLRSGSYNRMVADALVALAPDTLNFRFVEIGDLPLYNSDLDTDTPPAPWTRFREAMAGAQAVLFVTPEYNRSMPASIKNALDVGSRPMGASIWNGKPCAVVTASPGGIGGFGANHHLRQSLVFLNMPAMQQPEAYIGAVHTLFGEDGNLTSDGTRDFFGKIVSSFAAWVAKHA